MKNWMLLPFLVIAGCDLLEPVSCDTVGLPGLVIEVTDSISTLPVPGRYSVTARAGSYVDSGRFPPTVNDSVYYGAFTLVYERAGRYNIEVLAPGYRVWNRVGVQVTEDECHVRTVSINARLVRG